MRIESEFRPSEETMTILRAGMRRHAETFVPREEYADLALVARTNDGVVVGVALGETGRGWLHISVVWVEEGARRQGLGTQLVKGLEAEAVHRGCHGAYLDTFSYQARPFYEKLGYAVFGTLDDYPVGHHRF